MEQKPPRNEDDAQIIPFTVRCEELADGEKDVANAQIMRSLLSKYKSEIEQLSDYQKKTFMDSLYQWPDDVELDEEYIKYALEEADVRSETRELGTIGLRLVSQRSQEQIDREASKSRYPNAVQPKSGTPIEGRIVKDHGDLPDGVTPGDFGRRPSRYGARIQAKLDKLDSEE